MSEASKAKFTKGSWVGFNNGKWADCGAWSVDNDEASSYSNVAVNVGDVTICLVVSDSWNDEEMESNAHLIAAAPDMYAEIERDINILNRVIEKVESKEDKYLIKSWIDRKAALLAKARGE